MKQKINQFKINNKEVLATIIFLFSTLIVLLISLFVALFYNVFLNIVYKWSNSFITQLYLKINVIIWLAVFTSLWMRLFGPKFLKYFFWFHNILFVISLYWEYLYWKNKEKRDMLLNDFKEFTYNYLLGVYIVLFLYSITFTINDFTDNGWGLKSDLNLIVVAKDDWQYILSYSFTIANIYILWTSLFGLINLSFIKVVFKKWKSQVLSSTLNILGGLCLSVYFLHYKNIKNHEGEENEKFK